MDARWYIVANLGQEHGYLYVPAALVAASPA
jgi:hypothetical protein